MIFRNVRLKIIRAIFVFYDILYWHIFCIFTILSKEVSILKKFDKYGFYRAVEPKNSFLQTAWKIDNSMEIRENEMLVDVEILNINSISFAQMLEEANGNKEKIAKRIMEIIDKRGKLHNPVTGTGGMLYGRISKIGKTYCNKQGLKEGDEIISLVSLSTTPLKISKIKSIDIGFAQVAVEGKAIMFQCSLISKKPEDIPLRVLISAYDEAGAPTQTALIVEENDRVIILGAWCKLGLLCAYAAREKLGTKGKIVGVIHSGISREKLESSQVFDEILCCDIGNSLEFYNNYFAENKLFDVVINCAEESFTEMTTLLLVKNKGTAFFASLTGDCKVAGLTAESIGKDVTIIPYRGYVEGHTEYTSSLIRKYPKLRELIEEGHNSGITFLNALKNDDREFIETSLELISSQFNSKYVFESKVMKKVLTEALKVSKYNCTVMIIGESGTGKEIIAQFIYSNSKRNNFPFIKINCASIPENLLESELFGYERGSFTGADPKGKKGLWEMAQGGVLFLDEIGELPLSLQSKLLRVLQENEIYRIGGTRPIKTDARIIAATNKDISKMVQKGEFREDLFYRLNVFPINVPSLRERRCDIEMLTKVFTSEFNQKFDISKTIEKAAINYMAEYDWPGNIRELQNFVQRLLIDSESNIVKLEDVQKIKYFDSIKHNDILNKNNFIRQSYPVVMSGENSLIDALQEFEIEVLKQYKLKYKTTRGMANALGLTQSGVARRLIKYGI